MARSSAEREEKSGKRSSRYCRRNSYCNLVKKNTPFVCIVSSRSCKGKNKHAGFRRRWSHRRSQIHESRRRLVTPAAEKSRNTNGNELFAQICKRGNALFNICSREVWIAFWRGRDCITKLFEKRSRRKYAITSFINIMRTVIEINKSDSF